MKCIYQWGWIMGLISLAWISAASGAALPLVNVGTEGKDLRQWLLLGPFTASDSGVAEDADFLAQFGCSETGYERDRFIQFISGFGETRRNDGLSAQAIDRAEAISFNQIYKTNPLVGSPQNAVYAACNLSAESDGEAWLLLGSDDGAKVWLNGALLNTVKGRRGLSKYDDSVQLPIKKGDNLLVVKVSNYDGNWEMAARLEPNIGSAVKTTMRMSDALVRHLILPEGSCLEIAVRGLPATACLSAEIQDHAGRSVRALEFGRDKPVSLDGLPSGLYHVSVKSVSGQSRETAFVIGELSEIRKQLAKRSELCLHDDKVAINIAAQFRRLEILDVPFEPGANEEHWTQDQFDSSKEGGAVFAITEITSILDSIAANEEPFRNRTGLHFRGFRSVIDDQVFHYRLFVPSNYEPEYRGLPVIIIMQTVFNTNRPNIESPYFKYWKEMQEWCAVAERLGVGLLWPGYRNCPYGNPVDDTYLDEVLKTVALDYNLDTSRLYLYGKCSGGMTASMEMVRNPQRYAAVAYMNPVLHRLKHRFDDSGMFVRNTTYREYLKNSDPVEKLAGMPDIPIWIIQDGVDPDHGPLSHSVDFVELARALGHSPIFDHSHGETGESHLASMERQYKWLLEHRLASAVPLSFPAQTLEGPISRVFAERFIVVKGTLGSLAEKQASAKWCQDFLDSWKRLNYGPCRVINDIELTAEEEKVSNLVLMGNAKTNAVWQRLSDQLPVRLTDTDIIVGERKWTGDGLAIEAWFRHPQFEGRRIALIGAADLSSASVGTMELEEDGWFDCAIWAKGKPHAAILDALRYEPKK